MAVLVRCQGCGAEFRARIEAREGAVHDRKIETYARFDQLRGKKQTILAAAQPSAHVVDHRQAVGRAHQRGQVQRVVPDRLGQHARVGPAVDDGQRPTVRT